MTAFSQVRLTSLPLCSEHETRRAAPHRIASGKPICYVVAIVGLQGLAAINFGPIATFFPELFATRYRYSGSALAQNLAGIVDGAMPPLIAGTLQATSGSWVISLILATAVVVSIASVYLLPETNAITLRSTSSQLTDPPVEVGKMT